MWIPTHDELLEEVVRAPHGRTRPPAVVAPSATDPGLWLNMFNEKPPYLLDLDSMKKFMLEYKIFSKLPQTTSALYAAIRVRGTLGYPL